MKENYAHSYPFCWRSDTPLIYKAVDSWFINVESVKEKLLVNNTKTYWVPQFVQEKRFHNWLKDAKDWAVSRNRFWGTPIPLWVSDDGEEIVAIGSVEELYKLSGVKVTDLHKDTVDEITIPSAKGKGTLKRIEEVFDCWFESGSMPYAQLHYPFENRDRFENGFPADFVAEGLDQTRGWFYTLMVISTCLFDKPAFKNLIVNGLVLASDGKKMSKRLMNYPDPKIVTEANGADALRLYLINSPVVRADVLKFQEEGVQEVVRSVFIPWYNAFRFFSQSVDRHIDATGKAFVPSDQATRDTTNELDIWVLAAVFGLVDFVHTEMKAYRLYTVVPRLLDFIDQFTNWYVRLNRDRLKGANGAAEAFTGLSTLYTVLITMTQIMCPFTPFFCEYLYQHLRKFSPLYGNTDPSVPDDAMGKSASVHFLLLPDSDPSRFNEIAVSRFKAMQTATGLVRIARERRKIRSNYPLKQVVVVCADDADVEALTYLKTQFVGECNCKELNVSAEWVKLCKLTCQANFATMGKRLGKNMKQVGKAIASLSHEEISSFMESGTITVEGFELCKDDLVVKRSFNGDTDIFEACSSDDGKIMVAIDTSADEAILSELRARTMAATVQKLRKAGKLVVGEVIDVFYSTNQKKDKDGKGMKSISKALESYAESTVKRIRSLPLPADLKSPFAIEVIKETINDLDLCEFPVEVTLTRPAVAMDSTAVNGLVDSVDGLNSELVSMYLGSLGMSDSTSLTVAAPSGSKVVLQKGTHYYPNVKDMLSSNKGMRDKFSLPDLL